MKTKINYLLLLALGLVMYSCYPGGAEYVDELDTTISKYDASYAWDNLNGKTYSLPDEIVYVKDGDEVEDPDRTHDANIYKQMRAEFSNLGMTEVDMDDEDPSLLVGIVIIEQNNTGAAWIPGGGWWGGYYPGYPGWGWGGYYPWYPVYYSYKTGSVVIEMADYDNRDEEEETVPLVHSGVLDGLLQGNKGQIGARIERGIDELFNQAPF